MTLEMESTYRLLLYFSLFLIWEVTSSAAALSLQQTIPSAGIAVCIHSTVEFTCKAEDELRWRDVGTPSAQPATYAYTGTRINQTQMAGVFRTVLNDISGNTLTSTAAIDSVNLSDDGRTVECRQTASLIITDLEHTIQVEGPPPYPNNLTFNLLSTTDAGSSVNLTWSLDNQCVVVYHVEVTNTNTSNIINMNTTSQYIVLTLQTGVVYSFRVRGADSAGRGQWSEQSLFIPVPTFITSTTTIIPTTNVVATDSLFVVSTTVLVVIIVLLLAILTTVVVCFLAFKVRSSQRNAVQWRLQLQDYKHEPIKESRYDKVDLTKNQVSVSTNPAYAVILTSS